MNMSRLQDDVIAYAPGAVVLYYLNPALATPYLYYAGSVVAMDVANVGGSTARLLIPIGVAYAATMNPMATGIIFGTGLVSGLVMYQLKGSFMKSSSISNVQATSKVKDQ